MPFRTKRNGGKIVVVNLQKTRMDSHSDLVIHARCDDVMKIVANLLGMDVEEKKLNLPEGDDLLVIKESYRPEPPPLSKFIVKRIKKAPYLSDEKQTLDYSNCSKNSASEFLNQDIQNGNSAIKNSPSDCLNQDIQNGDSVIKNSDLSALKQECL